MGQALPGRGPASGPASGARKRSGHTLERGRPMGGAPNAHEQLSAEMLASGQFLESARSRPHCGVRRSPLVHWRLLTRLLDSPVVVWSWFCDIKIPHTDPYPRLHKKNACGVHHSSYGVHPLHVSFCNGTTLYATTCVQASACRPVNLPRVVRPSWPSWPSSPRSASRASPPVSASSS